MGTHSSDTPPRKTLQLALASVKHCRIVYPVMATDRPCRQATTLKPADATKTRTQRFIFLLTLNLTRHQFKRLTR